MSGSEHYHAVAKKARAHAQQATALAGQLSTLAAQTRKLIQGTATGADAKMLKHLETARTKLKATAADFSHAAMAAEKCAAEAAAAEKARAAGKGPALSLIHI